MRKLLAVCLVACALNGYVLAGSPGLAYLDQLNVFTANQRINAGLGINLAPPSTGNVSASGCYTESSRAACAGYFTAVSFSAGNFTCTSGGGSWTVTSSEQKAYEYSVIGKTMTLIFRVDNTQVSGTCNVLSIAIPGGFTADQPITGVPIIVDSGSSNFVTGLATTSAAGSTVNVQFLGSANFTVGTTTFVRFTLPISVQ